MRIVRRPVSVLLFAFYAAFLALGPVGDARLELSAAGATIHIEGQSDDSCPRAHDHDACLLCRVLRSAPCGGQVMVFTPAAPVLAYPTFAAPPHRTVSRLVPAGAPRAPPFA
jgi:hypothetical protein